MTAQPLYYPLKDLGIFPLLQEQPNLSIIHQQIKEYFLCCRNSLTFLLSINRFRNIFFAAGTAYTCIFRSLCNFQGTALN